MAEIAQPSLLHRIRHTPMRDVIRGRLTGRLDVRARIGTSDLPEAVKSLVNRVVKRTRLRSLERLDVADELIAHFRDGLESGTPIQELIQSFGEERHAVRLIRRAKKRNRPLVWHIAAAVGWLFVILMAFYIGWAIYFFSGRPSPKIDYFALLNSKVPQVPAEDHAWPIYRQVLLTLGYRSSEEQKELARLLDARVGTEHWSQLAAWLEQRRAIIAMVRDASRKPALGFVLGPSGSAYDRELWPDRVGPDSDPLWGPSLMSALLPHLNELRTLANMLAADAVLAREQRDPQRLNANITALIELARQLGSDDNLVSALVSVGIRHVAIEEIENTLVNAPDLLTDSHLRDLAHLISGPDVAADLIQLKSERLAFYDTVQRIYTDDGSGDGRLTPQAMRYASFWQFADTASQDSVAKLALPAISLPVASRRDVVREYDQIMNLAETNFARPRREADWEPFHRRLDEWRHSTLNSVRYGVLLMLLPSLDTLQVNAERYLGRRDGILVGIALELYRRQHGNYPESLELLTPGLLPRVPADRFTGDPVRYRVTDAGPIVYSVGADHDDDGGRPPLTRGGNINAWRAAYWYPDPATAPDGDWILYPLPRDNADQSR